MFKNVPPRLRAPLKIALFGVVAVAFAVAVHGWGSPIYLVLLPFLVLLALGYYAWSGRDSDSAAVIRREVDERQAYRRLKAQALVGKVMTLAAAAAYLVAVGAKVTLWPFAVALALPLLATASGWALYRDRD